MFRFFVAHDPSNSTQDFPGRKPVVLRVVWFAQDLMYQVWDNSMDKKLEEHIRRLRVIYELGSVDAIRMMSHGIDIVYEGIEQERSEGKRLTVRGRSGVATAARELERIRPIPRLVR
jgi:hypothetical protein